MDTAYRRALAGGSDVINLSVGSPDQPPASHIMDALQREVLNPHNYGYPMRDLPALRAAITSWYLNRFGVTLDPEAEVLGLSGSQDGLAHVTQAVADPGDLVLVPDPGYPIYSDGPVLAGAALHPVPLTPDRGYLPDLTAIPTAIAKRAKMIILNYPSNPLAATATPQFYREVVNFAVEHQVVVVHDAAYSELTFDGYRPPSFLETPGALEVGIEFNSLSKTFNMAGARVAYVVGNRRILAQLAKVKSHLDYGIFLPIQHAAVAALTGPQDCVREMAATYQRRRDTLVDGLHRLGWHVPRPRATMFCWAPIPEGDNSLSFAMALLERAGVTIVPGSGFGAMGEGYVRIALVQPEDRLREVVDRIDRSGILR